MIDPLYWQLEYTDGKVDKEGANNSSVRTARKGAVHMILVKPDGTEFVRVHLMEYKQSYKPIFYRIRSMSKVDASTRLDATVFGRGREDKSMIHTTLWAAIDGKVIDCPEYLIDARMIQMQVEEIH